MIEFSCPDLLGAELSQEVASSMESAARKTEVKPNTLTKADLVERVIHVAQLPRKDSEEAVEIVFESITQALQKSEKIEIRGFGSFRTRDRRGRIGRNPKTGERVEVPPKKIPHFKPSKELKDFVNEDRSTAGAAVAAGRD